MDYNEFDYFFEDEYTPGEYEDYNLHIFRDFVALILILILIGDTVLRLIPSPSFTPNITKYLHSDNAEYTYSIFGDRRLFVSNITLNSGSITLSFPDGIPNEGSFNVITKNTYLNISGKNTKIDTLDTNDSYVTRVTSFDGLNKIRLVSLGGELSSKLRYIENGQEVYIVTPYKDNNRDSYYIRFEADGTNPSITHGVYHRDITNESTETIVSGAMEGFQRVLVLPENAPAETYFYNINNLNNDLKNHYPSESIPFDPLNSDKLHDEVVLFIKDNEPRDEEEESPKPVVKNKKAPKPMVENKEVPEPMVENKVVPEPMVENKVVPEPMVENKKVSAPTIEKREVPKPVVENIKVPKPIVENIEVPKPTPKTSITDKILTIKDATSVLDSGDSTLIYDCITIHENYPSEVVTFTGHFKTKDLTLVSFSGKEVPYKTKSGAIVSTSGFFKIAPNSSITIVK